MKQFEYHVVRQPRSATPEVITDLLNSYGVKGWELAGIDYGYFMLKREKMRDD